jgi:SMC interacting uncharacterized protein involved in chromosome segregation
LKKDIEKQVSELKEKDKELEVYKTLNVATMATIGEKHVAHKAQISALEMSIVKHEEEIRALTTALDSARNDINDRTKQGQLQVVIKNCL